MLLHSVKKKKKFVSNLWVFFSTVKGESRVRDRNHPSRAIPNQTSRSRPRPADLSTPSAAGLWDLLDQSGDRIWTRLAALEVLEVGYRLDPDLEAAGSLWEAVSRLDLAQAVEVEAYLIPLGRLAGGNLEFLGISLRECEV